MNNAAKKYHKLFVPPENKELEKAKILKLIEELQRRLKSPEQARKAAHLLSDWINRPTADKIES